MKTQLKTLSFGLLSALLLTGTAFAQSAAQPCAEREKVVKRLTSNYGVHGNYGRQPSPWISCCPT